MDELYNITENAQNDTEDAKSEVEDEAPAEAVEDIEKRSDPEGVDYEALIASDIETLRSEFPELREINDITDLNNPLRYAALRDLGLTPEEAYLATAKRRTQDTRAHLRSAHGRNAATSVSIMSQRELSAARDLFPDLSDSELQRLYKRVTK
jgi:hypothetical protein